VAVTVDRYGFDRSLERAHDAVGVLFRAQRPGGGDARGALARAVTAANSAADECGTDGPDVSGDMPVATPHGPALFVDIWAASALVRWLDYLAEELERERWSGTLEPVEWEHPRLGIDPMQRPLWPFAAVLSLEGWRPDRLDNLRAAAPWRSDPTLSTELAVWAVDWLCVLGDEFYLSQERTSFRVERDFCVQALADALAGTVTYPAVICRGAGDAVRRVCFTPLGRIILTAQEVKSGWQKQAAALMDVVRQHAHRCEAAIVRQARLMPTTMVSVVNEVPPTLPNKSSNRAPTWYYRTRRDLDHVTVPDAYGLLLITDAHLQRARELSRWRISQPAPGKYLLEAKDLAAWFAQPEVDPEILAAARFELGDMILWAEPRRLP